MPEFCAPALGNRANLVTIEADIPDHPNGVLYALGGAGGGLTCYVDDGYLCYEYNLFIIMRTKIRSTQRLSPGPATIQIETTVLQRRPGSPLGISLGTGLPPFSLTLMGRSVRPRWRLVGVSRTRSG